jgi:hypothetical protein
MGNKCAVGKGEIGQGREGEERTRGMGRENS